jgi:PIN domain nuclease of toxin-antitoxin system
MRILLDTHVWLWLQVSPERVSAANLELLAAPDTERLLSVASAWEIAIKFAIGKLPLPEPPSRYVPARMSTSATRPLHVSLQHALAVAELPRHHSDPFDRLLVAQAQAEKLPIMTADDKLAPYDVELLAP